jgi:hypothetical protein
MLLQQEVERLHGQMKALEDTLSTRPPVDLTELSNRIGFQLLDNNNSNNNSSSGHSATGNSRACSWSEVETVIVDTIRKAHSEAVESRIKEQDSLKQLDALQQQNSDLARALALQKESMIALERDLLSAQSQLQGQGNALASPRPAQHAQSQSQLQQQHYKTGRHVKSTTAGALNAHTAAVLNEISDSAMAGNDSPVVKESGNSAAQDKLLQVRDVFSASYVLVSSYPGMCAWCVVFSRCKTRGIGS